MSDARHSAIDVRFNPQRLSIARRRRGLTKVGLADELEITVRMITAYETGEKRPPFTTLQGIADQLGFPVQFFGGDDLDEPTRSMTSFRALTNLTAREQHQATTAGALAIAFSDWIDQRFVLPEPAIPHYQGLEPEAAAIALRSEWGLGERPIRNMITTLEAHGVRVFSLAQECQSVDAFSFRRNGRPFVILNTRKSAEHSRMDAAHELGHLVLHWKDKPQGRRAEHEAAQFGSAFLMSRGSVIADAPRSGTLPDLIAAKKRWRVSLSALTYRLHEVGVLSDWQYRTLFMQISSLGYKTREPQGIEPETSGVLAQVLQQLRDEGMGSSDVAEALAIPPEELNALVFGLVLAPVGSPGKPVTSKDQRADRSHLRLL